MAPRRTRTASAASWSRQERKAASHAATADSAARFTSLSSQRSEGVFPPKASEAIRTARESVFPRPFARSLL